MTHVTLRRGCAIGEIKLAGAELGSWSIDGVPLLWESDPAVWAETAPLLFPIVGWTRNSKIVVDGAPYPLGLHGFARARTFKVLEQWPSHVRLGLESSEETRRSYPFDWTFEVTYTLEDAALDVELTIANTGATPMPYACGLHPGFAWPFAGGELEDYVILFGERERASVPIISGDGLFTHQRRRVPLDGRRLPLSPALMASEALCFLDTKSRSLRFAHRSGAAIDVALRDFPHIALWSRPGGRFLCIEAWTGHGDFIDAAGDLFRKPSMRHLPPGTSARHGAKFSFGAAHSLLR